MAATSIQMPIKLLSMLWKSSLLGILIGLGTAGFLQICHALDHKILNPNLLFALAIVSSTYKRGNLAGFFSAAIAIVYTMISWSKAGSLFVYSSDNLQRLIVVFLCMPLMALLVGLLKKQTDTQQQQLSHYVEQLKELASTDELTALANRRSFSEHLEWSIHNAKRKAQSFSLAIIDLDHFKQVNDNYGHSTGDKVLRAVGEALGQACRQNDFPARFGGEEFVVLLHETDVKEAITIAERIRTQISAIQIIDRKISASIGVSTSNLPAFDSVQKICEQAIQNADRALYIAKQGGRNQVVHYQDINQDNSQAFNSAAREPAGAESTGRT